MTPPRSGQCFWLWNRTLDIFAPGTGTRRIQARLETTSRDRDAALQCNSELASENKFLRRELYRLTGENNLLIAQDEMNALFRESEFVHPSLLISSSAENPVSHRVVN